MRHPSLFAPLGATLALVGPSLAWNSSCLSACRPNVTAGIKYPSGPSDNGHYMCPQEAGAPYAYVVSLAAENGTQCPGSCTPIGHHSDCEAAAVWLRLGMNGEPGPCPLVEDLVGENGFWRPNVINAYTEPAWKERLSGCSWRPNAAGSKLTFNRGNVSSNEPLADLNAPANLDNWLICTCATPADMPQYVPVTSGQRCPAYEYDVYDQKPLTCIPLTSEVCCEEAASDLNFTDTSLDMCEADCGLANQSDIRSINSKPVSPHRPAGCHYRHHTDRNDDHLWFNPYVGINAAEPAYTKPMGAGFNPDFMICGCGATAHRAQATGPAGCREISSGGVTRSKACGHGQTCSPHSLNDILCTCDYEPTNAVNEPATCNESIPIKYISWVHGSECPFDNHTQCLPPPTKERCEAAASALHLSDTIASLPTLQEHQDRPQGCHYIHGDTPDKLWWNANASGAGMASVNNSLICECRMYPQFVPKLGGDSCASSEGCRDVRTWFKCAWAADATKLPVPALPRQLEYQTTLCMLSDGAGAGSPYQPCFSMPSLDCSASDAVVRTCYWSDGGWELMVDKTPGSVNLDGCYYNPAGGGDTPLHFVETVTSPVNSTPEDFRLCDCNVEAEQGVIADSMGFDFVGDGDCAGEIVPSCPPEAPNGTCVTTNGTTYLRAERYNCTGLSKEACHADAGICRWWESNSTCDWKNNQYRQGEIEAFFSDCMEHCYMLCHCTGISFFVPDGATINETGGCDFFKGPIVAGTGEAILEGKGPGNFTCWGNTPDNPVPTPAPTYDCPQCEMIQNRFECRNTWGCVWSTAGYCCCDPFVSSCTDAWHTHTDTEEKCEAQYDDGVQCRWLASPDTGSGICELPVADCVDELADLELNCTLAAAGGNETQLCIDVFTFLKNTLGLPHFNKGCGQSCNVSEVGGTVQLSLGVNLAGKKSCGQSTRIANRHSDKVETFRTVGSGVINGCKLLSHNIRSKCWDDCATDPKCPKGPTAAPTPLFTRPPSPSLQQGFPTSPPTSSPTTDPTCPPLQATSSEPFVCNCERFSCEDAVPAWSDRDYRFCGTCPDFLDNSTVYQCPHCANIGTQINVTCPDSYQACDLFLLAYHHRPCSANGTHSINGGWVSNLPPDGWTSGSCGPSFCLNSTVTGQNFTTNAVTQENETHIRWRFVMFHKQISGGDVEQLPEAQTDPTMYFVVFVKEGRLCGNHLTSQTDCEEQPGICKWDSASNQCKLPFICPRTPGGTGSGPPAGGSSPTECIDGAPGAPMGNCTTLDITNPVNFIV